MAFFIQKVAYGHATPRDGENVVYLAANNWDDHGNKTQFFVTVFDKNRNKYELGDVKIGYLGQKDKWTFEQLPNEGTPTLPVQFFSLGQDVEYYKSIYKLLPANLRNEYLVAMRDVIADEALLAQVKDENVFAVSLTRGIGAEAVFGQFQRVLRDEAVLTPFYFRYYRPKSEEYSGIDIDFDILPSSTPPTNIHVLIGRNGIGKTSLLNNMVSSLVNKNYDAGAFFERTFMGKVKQINPDQFFSSVISVSFSAFDRFIPPPNRDDPEQGLRYTYIGLKKAVQDDNGNGRTIHKDHPALCDDFISSVLGCFRNSARRKRWEIAINELESDSNFADMNLVENLNFDSQDEQQKVKLISKCKHLFDTKLSSGHAIVLLTITQLVEKVDEKTLVILDEPESHLHPPLLSAFTRALSYLLLNRNGVALIATHSPVILQEVPRSCVWKIRRLRLDLQSERPELETFGENVGVLTREVFGLEVFQSGFYAMLAELVEEGNTFEQIMDEFQQQIGFEGKALLNSLIANRGEENDA